MNIVFQCPECGQGCQAAINSSGGDFSCAHCGARWEAPSDALDGDRLTHCLLCPSTDLFVRKDFPQRLGVAIVTIGILASCVAWGYREMYWTFGILFFTALLDVVLYIVVPMALMCYRCGAQYRGVVAQENHAAFNLETHERHRQQKARLEEHRVN